MNINPNDFSIDQSNIDNELCSLGSKMFQYGETEGEWRVNLDRDKSDLEFTEAVLDADIRNKAKESGSKKTEAQIKNEIIQDPLYKQSLDKLMEDQDRYNRIKAAMVALSAKRDCLIALSYRDRQMMKTNVY